MIGAIGVGLLFCVGVLLSLRLVVHGFRYGELAPLLVAMALLLLGPGSLTLAVLAVSYATSHPDLSHLLGSGAAATSSLGIACAALVTTVVFRGRSRLGWTATCVLIALMAGCVVGATIAENGIDLRRTPTGFRLGYQALQLGTLLWSSVEALVTWHLLKGRIRLGVADPLVANRIGLWGVATGLTSIGMAIGYMATFFGLHYSRVLVELAVSGLGLLAAAALWLSFVPPARYRAWVLKRRPGAGPPQADANALRWPAG